MEIIASNLIKQMSAPILSVGKVLVEVKTADINPVDWKIRKGYKKQMIKPR
jgi:NADPH:quinone reductase-like Zn-dependent oxidoreductase